MGWFVKFTFVLEIILLIILFAVDFSNSVYENTINAVLISLAGGIFVFILFNFLSGLSHFKLKKKAKKDKLLLAKLNRKKKRDKFIGLVLLIVSIIIFLNSYLYIKALLGNDMIISLKSDTENFVLKNGENQQFMVEAKILTNPFCEASCSLSLYDLSKSEFVYSENIYLKFSSPISRDYTLGSNEDKYGQSLYKLQLECVTLKSGLCYASIGTLKSRTKILSVNYNLNETQEETKDELKNETESINKKLHEIKNSLDYLNLNYYFLDLSEFEGEFLNLNMLSDSLLEEANSLNDLYADQEYFSLQEKANDMLDKVNILNNRFDILNLSVKSDINDYNKLVDNVSSMYGEILYLEDYVFSNYSISYANSFVEEFNSMVLELDTKDTIQNKLYLFNKINLKRENLSALLEEENISGILGENALNSSIYPPTNLQKIKVESENYSYSFTLDEPSPICCSDDECYSCIDDSSSNYPIILVHGHSFNEKLSAELSMEAFSDMANHLEDEGYLDAGYFYGSEYSEISRGYLGKINKSIVVEATYYIDTSVTEEGSFILDSKWEDIDTYSERLNEIITNVKYLTGKDKVIIVAHSMGGLVTRNYVRLYGDENIDRLVLVGIPNHGIDGFVRNYCATFGADIECSEMDETSTFIHELNSASLPNVPIYNIVGLGCFWENSKGDGIVKNESAYLSGENVENIYVNGTCSGVDFFHVKMIKPTWYPEIYKVIKGFIEQ